MLMMLLASLERAGDTKRLVSFLVSFRQAGVT
jgi:hypothetical protein